MTNEEFDFDATYKVEGYNGIAWRVDQYAVEEYEVEIPHEVENDYGELETTYEYDIELVEDRTRVVCHMVGDDREFIHDITDLTKLSDDEYCPECGQIGCKAYG